MKDKAKPYLYIFKSERQRGANSVPSESTKSPPPLPKQFSQD